MTALDTDGQATESWGKSAGFLAVATIVVSVGNYAFSLAAVHLLSPNEFATFAASQGLLLVLGTACMAAVPWSMARYMARDGGRTAGPEAMFFGLIASAWQALAVAAIAGGVMWVTAGPVVGAIAMMSAALIAMAAAPTGFLQGANRVAAIGWLRVTETAGRVIAGLGLVLLFSHSAAYALLGFPIGTALLLVVGAFLTRRGFPLSRPRPSAVRELMRQSLRLGLIQVLLAMLAAIDGVVAYASRFDDITSGSYQAAALLGRVPLFLSGAIGLAAYTAMAAAGGEEEVGQHLRRAVLMFSAVALPIVVACWTVPPPLLNIVIPAEYSVAPTLLRFAVVSGALIGLISVLTTAHQARSRFRVIGRVLLLAAIVQPVLLLIVGRTAGVIAFAWVLVGVSAITTVFVCWDARRWHPFRAPTGRLGWLLVIVALGSAFLITNPVAWILYITAVSAASLLMAARAFKERPTAGGSVAATPIPEAGGPSR